MQFVYTGSNTKSVVLSFRFAVLLDKDIYAFQAISGLNMKRDFDYISEGGRNDYAIRLIKPQSTPYEITFKRGIPIGSSGDPYFSDYFCGMDSLQNKDQAYKNTFKIRGKAGTIYVLDERNSIKTTYTFTCQGMSGWEVSDLDAMNGNSVLIESMTLIHNGLFRRATEQKGMFSIPRVATMYDNPLDKISNVTDLVSDAANSVGSLASSTVSSAVSSVDEVIDSGANILESTSSVINKPADLIDDSIDKGLDSIDDLENSAENVEENSINFAKDTKEYAKKTKDFFNNEKDNTSQNTETNNSNEEIETDDSNEKT